jgi:hypothetical protein
VIANVAILGLSCAFNPVLLGIVLLTLASERPKGMLGAYLAGAFTWSVGLGIGAVAVATSAGVFGSRSSSSNPIIDIAVGALLIAGALLYATGRVQRWRARRAARAAARAPREPQKPPLAERLLSGSIGLAFVAGVILNFPSLRYIEALKEIAVANVSQREQILAVLLFNLLMLSPAIVPLAFLVFRPEGTKAAVARLDAWMRAHSRVLLTLALGATGLYLTGKGIAGLA